MFYLTLAKLQYKIIVRFYLNRLSLLFDLLIAFFLFFEDKAKWMYVKLY
jgi:hypothetical protein